MSPIQLLESGPAGGVLSAVRTARQARVEDVLALDMGGTTAKACVATAGAPDVAHRFEAARVRRFIKGSGLPVLIPSIDLIEIGAGGGSIAHVNRLGLLEVGPRSAGAQPGPACYGLGGDAPTVTDADLLLGFLDPHNFLGGEMLLHVDRARQALAGLGRQLGGMTARDAAWGVHDLVNENMAAAARVHVAEKGLDPRRFTLVATGGAGPVHAVEVAHKLGVRRVLCTVAAGAGSCLGLLAAPARVDRAWSRVQRLADVRTPELARQVTRMHTSAARALSSVGSGRAGFSLGAELRFQGQGNSVDVTIPYRGIDARTVEKVRKAFEARYIELYGALVPGGRPEVVTWRLTGQVNTRQAGLRMALSGHGAGAPHPAPRPVFVPARKRMMPVPVYERYALTPGTTLRAPAVLQERESTIVVARPATIEILDSGTASIELD